MFVSGENTIGERLLSIRKSRSMTQAEVAEAAGISDRTYADIERGTANMRTQTLLRLCAVLGITPNDILMEEEGDITRQREALWAQLQDCTLQEQKTAMELLGVYLQSLHKE